MKILLVDGIFPINTRNRRIISTLKKQYLNVKYCSWNRKNSEINFLEKDNYIYSSNEGYGNKIKKLLGIFKFYKFLKIKLKENQVDILIASQWDMLLLCFFLKNQNQKLIYDNIDMPSSKNKFILYILKKIEKRCLKKVDILIHSSRFFKDKYKFFKNKQVVIENLPLKENLSLKKISSSKNKVKISFIGTIRYFNVLSLLIDFAKLKDNDIELLFFGSGPDLEKLKKRIVINKQSNVKIFGEYDYKEISSFYEMSDLIWAVYPSENYNVKYAISNKFFESIIYEKPCCFAKGTLLAELVEKEGIGITIDSTNIDSLIQELGDLEKLQNKINKIKENIKIYKKKEKNIFWEDIENKILDLL